MNAKEIAALKALEWVQQGMTIGLGTGSTAHFFTLHLARRCQEGLRIQAIASSSNTLKLAKQLGIPLVDPLATTHIDLTVDGADEIDPHKQMIKGGGGALVREKIVAAMSRTMVIIVDSSKRVEKLGKRPLPVEILPFGAESTKAKLAALGYRGTWRENPKRFLTDNGNFILDIHFDQLRDHPQQDAAAIEKIPGVIDTGFFFDLADVCIIGYADGKVEVWN